jgi:hypothetical protein
LIVQRTNPLIVIDASGANVARIDLPHLAAARPDHQPRHRSRRRAQFDPPPSIVTGRPARTGRRQRRQYFVAAARSR